MKHPLISISITVYNLEKYVGACIESILNQELTDFECIIIDDGSSDRSGEICRSYAQIDDRITYIHQANQGVSAARNRAIEESNGDYLLLADGDDLLDPTMLKKLYALCKVNHADISTCLNRSVTEKDDRLFQTNINDEIDYHIYTNEEALTKLYSNELSGFGLCNKLYHRKLFKDVRFPFDRSFEDAAIQYQLLYQANKIIFTEERLYYYRIHQDSLTRSQLIKFSHLRLDIIKNFEETMFYFKQNRVTSHVIDLILADYFRSLRGLIIDLEKEEKSVQLIPLQIVTNQIRLWKDSFLSNPYLSKKELIFIWLWTHLPNLTSALYHIRNRFAIKEN